MDGTMPGVYCDGVPDFLRRAAAAPAIARLRDIGMNCGCEYTSFERFRRLAPYSRWEHSLGAALITWRFTGSARQAMAALCHDIATPCFAHAIDFLNGDHLSQESTEAGTEALIAADPALCDVLAALGLAPGDVADYHRFPIADNDTPRLSADRLEYTLGNAVNFGLASPAAAAEAYADLCVATAEDGAPELAFRRADAARRFCEWSLACSGIYVSDEDRCAMQYLAELLGEAVGAGAIRYADLWRTEPEVISALQASDAFRARWRAFRALNATRRGGGGPCPPGEGWRVIPAKKRWIDPLVGGARASAVFPDWARAVRAFLALSWDEPVRALTLRG